MLNNMTIKMRLLTLVAFMSFMIFLIGAIGFYGSRVLLEGQKTIYQGGTDSINQLKDLLIAYETKVETAVKLQLKTIGWEEGEKRINEADQLFVKAWNGYRKTDLSPEQLKASEQLAPILQNASASIKNLLAIIARKDAEQLSEYLSKEMFPAIDPAIKEIASLMQLHDEQTSMEYNSEIGFGSTISAVLLALLIASISIGIITSLIIIRNITHVLDYAIANVNRLALGDTSVQLNISTKDEIGQLLIAMQSMIKASNTMVSAVESVASGDLNISITPRADCDALGIALNEMITKQRVLVNAVETVASGDLSINVTPRSDRDVLGVALKDMILKLRKMITEVQAEVQVVTASTQEIVTSVTQVSANTTETASAVTETTTTTEELKQTAHVSAEKAQGVLDNAEETLKIVKASEQSLNTTISDMNQIQEKMGTISESLLTLLFARTGLPL